MKKLTSANRTNRRMKRILVACVAAASTAVGTTSCSGASGPPEAIAVDAIAARPVCFAATLVGSALFVVSLPVAATLKSVHGMAEYLVVRPAHATFKRSWGDFSEFGY